eukprot:5584983-Pyramimonas_sp.AAC.1
MTCVRVAASKLGVGGPATSRTELDFPPRRVALAGGLEGQEDILNCAADEEDETTAEPGGLV